MTKTNVHILKYLSVLVNIWCHGCFEHVKR